jgi:hypothetical protein
VIGVKHIFENEIYTNEITAVKIFIRDLTNTRSKPARPTNRSITPAVEPAPIKTNQNFTSPNNTTVYPSDTPQLPTASESPIDSSGDTNLLPTEGNDSTDGPSSSLFPVGEPVTDETVIPDNQQQSNEVDPADVDMDFGTIPEGAPFAPDADASTLPASAGISRIEQSRRESPFNIVKVGGVDPATAARIAEQRAQRDAILRR